VKINGGLRLDEYKGVSIISGNSMKPPKNIIFNPPKGLNHEDFNFCNLRCILVNMVHPTIDISSIIK
jgi:hypothetical protein